MRTIIARRAAAFAAGEAANQPVEWRVAPTADGKSVRTIRYEPLATETHLLYLACANANRRRVDRDSEGRLAYIHIPDMGEAGIREFIKWWYPQVRKEGLIVDVRDNGGGNISQMLIERLARHLGGLDYVRNFQVPLTYPSVVQPQLERGIAELMKQLPEKPVGPPERPAPPIKTPGS
jgi:tricorn protease